MVSKYKDILLKSGYVPINNGSIIISSSAKDLFESWLRVLSAILSPYYSIAYQSPLFIGKELLETSRYLQHFPQQLFQVTPFNQPSVKKYITPATCLHIYELLKNKKLENSMFNVLISGRCARVENNKSEFPFRLNSFNMMEVVLIGSDEEINKLRQEIQTLLDNFFEKIGFSGEFVTATDAFFLGNDEGAKALQKLKELKKEYAAPFRKEKVALASTNNHEEYFGKLFNIKDSSNGYITSVCIAFGIERLTAYSLIKWGANKENWPREFRI